MMTRKSSLLIATVFLFLSLTTCISHAHDTDDDGDRTLDNNETDAPKHKTCLGHTLVIPPDSPKQRLVIAHRGASAHLPEHTLGAYQLALELGADFIEPDLVASSDGQLLAMHTSDLNVTSNVLQVFGDSREPWFSPFANRSGYWAFNFTADEIRQLKVKQRLPQARTTMYDMVFGIPMLDDILDLLNAYNTVTLKNYVSADEESAGNSNGPTPVHLSQAGMYAELKDSVWLKEEAGLDLVEILLNHIKASPSKWDPLLQCYSKLKHDEFIVPGLVIQSFDPDALQRLHKAWPNALNDEEYGLPPSILLVSAPDCWADEFWFQLGDEWRSFIDGLGPDKKCLLDDQAGAAFLEKAKQFDMVLHPWTERPETIYLTDGFDNVFDETKHLYCHCEVQAVFSESVSTAKAAIAVGCDPENGSDATDAPSETPASDSSENNKSQSDSGESLASYCTDKTGPSDITLTASAFAIGVVVTLLMSCFVKRRAAKQGNSGRRRIPSFENELELT